MSTLHHSGADVTSHFEHGVLFYDTDDEYVRRVGDFVQAALDEDKPVLVAVPRVKLDLLATRFDRSLPGLAFADMGDMGRNPAWIIPAWIDFVRPHLDAGRTPAGVGEPVWGTRSDDEMVECHRHEQLLNLALIDTPGFQLLCPYDTRELSDEALADATVRHPHRHDGDALGTNPAYHVAIPAQQIDPLSSPPSGAASAELTTRGDISTIRAQIVEAGQASGLVGERLDALAVSVSEALANSEEHGGGQASIRYWDAGDRFVCEIRDRGAITDPLAGRRRPAADSPAGRGLWLIHQLCDLVQIRQTDSDEQVIRLHVGL